MSSDLFGAPAVEEERLGALPSSGFFRGARVAVAAPPPPRNGPRRVVKVDSFAGGGGATNGCEMAMQILEGMGLLPTGHGTSVDFAVNHDEAALAMHTANHPATIHLPHNVWKVNMADLLGDDFFGLLWLSPDCRDHSPAKGGPITSKSVRDLAWVLVRWLKELPDWQRPWAVFLENVGAFSKWSPLVPLPDGGYARDESRLGETFHRFVKALARFGYSIGWRELVACDYGDPTIRKRLYMVLRRDGGEITWPAPTHGDPKSEAVKSGKLQPWPVAADILDFSLPCPSILMTKEEARAYTKATGQRIIRPLAFKSDARLAKGVKRYVIDAAAKDEAFIVTINHGGDAFRGQSVRDPMSTVTRARDAHGLVVPHVAAFRGDQIGRSVDDPLATVTANSFHKRPGGAAPLGVVETSVSPFVAGLAHGDSGGRREYGPDEPLRTVHAGGNNQAVASPILVPIVSRAQHGGGNRPADAPMHTIAASDGDQNQVIVPYLVPRYGEREGQEPRTFPIDRPLPTPVPDGNQGSLASVFLAQHNTGVIGHDVREPMSTIVQKGCTQAVVEATFIKRDFGNSVGASLDEPLGAVTAGGGGKADLIAAHMLSLKGSDRRDSSVEAPHPTVCAGGQHSAVVTLPLMTAYFGKSESMPVTDPLGVAGTRDRFGLAPAYAAIPPLTEAQIARARQVADFLRRHGCWDDREFVTVTIRGILYVIIDIGMRMLTPRELARAQGFPDSYILAAPFKGGTLSETEQRHKIGNSVCRRPAAAIIVENYRPPLEWGRVEFMEAAE